MRNLLDIGIERLFVALHQPLAAAVADRHRGDFRLEQAGLDRLLSTRQRGDRKRILLFAGESELVRAILGEGAHQPPLVVGVLQAIEKHMIYRLGVPQPHAGARLRQQIGSIAHALHATRHHHLIGSRQQQIVRQHGRLHPRSAHLADCGAAGGERQSGTQTGLARRCLPKPGRQHVAHQHLLHVFRGDAGGCHRRFDRDRAQFRCGLRSQCALEPAHRGAHGADDDDWIVHVLLQLWLTVSHRVSLNSSRPISMRRISEVPAPISYNLASRSRRPVGYSLM